MSNHRKDPHYILKFRSKF